MKLSYDDLSQFDNSKGLRQLIQKWDVLSENIRDYVVGKPIVIPDLFVVSQSRHIVHKLVSFLSSYFLVRKNLMEFDGDERYHEFVLNYCEPNRQFTEIHRLIDEIGIAAGFRRDFRGIVHIEVDPWLGHQNEHHFLNFMDYLAENTGDWLIVLSVASGSSDKRKEQITAMESVLSMFLRIERITLNTASTQSYVEELASSLLTYGLRLDDSARELLKGSISVLRKNRYFDSSHSISLLCSDIVYEIYSRKGAQPGLLSAADLAVFSAENDYIHRTVTKAKDVRRVGFLTETDKED